MGASGSIRDALKQGDDGKIERGKEYTYIGITKAAIATVKRKKIPPQRTRTPG
jgi:hypothetical protein